MDGIERSKLLPNVNEGDELDLVALQKEQKFTKPPTRYTEATLIKELQKRGLGRPSTYAPTISTILDRKYIEKNGRLLQITDLGKIVTNMLSENFSILTESKIKRTYMSKKYTVRVFLFGLLILNNKIRFIAFINICFGLF